MKTTNKAMSGCTRNDGKVEISMEDMEKQDFERLMGQVIGGIKGLGKCQRDFWQVLIKKWYCEGKWTDLERDLSYIAVSVWGGDTLITLEQVHGQVFNLAGQTEDLLAEIGKHLGITRNSDRVLYLMEMVECA